MKKRNIVIIVVAIIAALAAIYIVALLTGNVQFEDDAQDPETQTQTVQGSTSPAENTTPVETAEEDNTTLEGEGSISDYHVQIVSAAKSTDYQDRYVIVVTYKWTNNSDKSTSFSAALTAKAFQDGMDTNQPNAEIKPGAELELQKAYILNDDSDVTVEVEALFSFDDTVITKTFSVK